MSNINENTVTMFPIMNPDQEDTQNSFTMTNGTLKVRNMQHPSQSILLT